MKKIKKVLAVILSLAMVLGMSLTAFAATPSNSDKADLTITGLEKGVTVKLYQIAHAEYGEGAVKGLLKYEWNTGVAFANPDEPTVDEINAVAQNIATLGNLVDTKTLGEGETSYTYNAEAGAYIAILTSADNDTVYNPIILSAAYGKEGAEIIVDNTQLTLFGGFAPNSSSAETLSKALGSRTVMSGSVSRSKNDPSQSLQMIERPLLTAEELKSMPKGQFVVMKTGIHPMRVKLKLFYKWGIKFNEDEPYTVPDNGNREVKYAEKKEIIDGIVQKYHPDWLQKQDADDGESDNAENQEENYTHERYPVSKKKNGTRINSTPPSRRRKSSQINQEVNQNGQT